MKIYNYNKETGEFLSESEAKKNPLEKDKYLIPKNATKDAPLENKDGFARCFLNGKWEYVVDNRNKTYFLNGKKVDFELGDEITSEMTLNQFSDSELLDQLRVTKYAEVNAEYEKPYSVIVDGVSYNNGESSALAIYNAVNVKMESNALLGTSFTTVDITDVENKPHTLTFNEAKILAIQIGAKAQENFQKKQALKVKIKEASTIEAVNSVVWA